MRSRAAPPSTTRSRGRSTPASTRAARMRIGSNATTRSARCRASRACCADARRRLRGNRMSTYRAPLSDMRFVLFDVLGADALFARLGFESATRDTVDAVLEEGARFTQSVLAPLNAVGD